MANCVNIVSPNLYYDYVFLLLRTKENLTVDLLENKAIELGINKEKLSSCFINNESQSAVDIDINLGYKSGVYGTPTFFINNQVIVGPKDYKVFENIIDSELK